MGDYFILHDRINGPNRFQTPGSDPQQGQEYRDKQLKVDSRTYRKRDREQKKKIGNVPLIQLATLETPKIREIHKEGP
jgi:hypothetical protein